MITRLAALSLVLVAGVVVIHGAVPELPQIHRLPFAQLPPVIGTWRSAGEIPIDDESLKVLNADDYVNRLYVSGNVGVDLFMAYYGTQRQGDTMHSPMNCLPASGWQPMSTDRVQLPLDAGAKQEVLMYATIF